MQDKECRRVDVAVREVINVPIDCLSSSKQRKKVGRNQVVTRHQI